jgi:energy-coupling factor transporter ATP-binding protein EcfA2
MVGTTEILANAASREENRVTEAVRPSARDFESLSFLLISAASGILKHTLAKFFTGTTPKTRCFEGLYQ